MKIDGVVYAARRDAMLCAGCGVPVLRGQEWCPSCRLFRAIARTTSLQCLELALKDKRSGRL